MKTMWTIASCMIALVVLPVKAVPEALLDAIEHQESRGRYVDRLERNGQISYGPYQISSAFIRDVNRYFGTSYRISDVASNKEHARSVCRLGIRMLMRKHRCGYREALMRYNGGARYRSAKCSVYADKILRRYSSITKETLE